MGKNKKRFMLLMFFGLILIIATGCGNKSQEKVIKEIEGKLERINGYKYEAEMTMKTGQEERSYDIDIWYKKGEENFYRVELENEDEENGQVILKNDEGVFVLTPALNKSFKFQSGWPDNSSQPYLYQSIVDDVIMDKDAVFTAADSHYIFLTKTNYQNNTNLPYQEIHFDKKSYLPAVVHVMDKDRNILVEVSFSNLEINPTFQEKDFDRDAILEDTLADLSVANMEQRETLAVTFPLNTLGAELVERQEISLEDSERVIMTFKGERNFTLIQEKMTAIPTSTQVQEIDGEVVNLGHSIGAVSGNAIEWNYNGTDFYLASEDMTIEELIEVASSVQGQGIK